jgi:hypothetical protein
MSDFCSLKPPIDASSYHFVESFCACKNPLSLELLCGIQRAQPASGYRAGRRLAHERELSDHRC